MPLHKKILNIIGILIVFFLAIYFGAWVLNKRLEHTTKEELIQKTLNYNSIALDKFDSEIKQKAFDTEMKFVVFGILGIVLLLSIKNLKNFKFKEFLKNLLSIKFLLLLVVLLASIPLKIQIEHYALNNPETPLKELNISKWFIYLYILVVIAIKLFIKKYYDLFQENDFKKMKKRDKLLMISFVVIFVIVISFFKEEFVRIIGPLGIKFAYLIVDFYKNMGLL